ncbi:MAG: ATP-binding cassette domain-containing protein, partial [Acidobacteriota bacterium]
TTLMRIVARELFADEGTSGIAGTVELVHQHFMLVSDFTIAENLALTEGRRSLLTKSHLLADARRAIAASGIELRDEDRRVATLSVGEKAKLELVKAISRRPSLLILDEPTSVLTPAESSELFAVIRRLAAGGTAVVFISHKLPEVLEIAGRIVVMRGGRIVANTQSMPAEELANAMVGERTAPPPEPESDTSAHETWLALRLDDLELHYGEIVAIVGVAGNGQTELAERLRNMKHAGTIAHIPEDRTRDGLVAEMSLAENIALAGGRWNRRRAREKAARLIAAYSIRASGPGQRAGSLSGGNQQKVILARELDREPAVIVAAEPTRGLDLDATAFVHDKLRRAAARGAGILLITSDLDEAFALAGTIQVIYRGRLSSRMNRTEAAARVGALMAGIA